MKHVIIGTAGHVDHGKTRLVKALTGKDTDRLKEEKERGISIELGFAPFVLPSGRRVAIIDVPGHERFIKHMLAGVGGIDLVMLVIAADEGVMPQTREHLDIIQLLQIPRGIIVISKTDLVDSDWLQLVMEEVREQMTGTILADAPMVGVSAATGEGMPQLMALLEEAVEQVRERPATGRFRMPADRVFSITGFGTVVTGTLTSGRVKVGDTIEILPENLEARVRTLQVHGDKVEMAEAGQRVAVNLSGVEVQDLNRGSILAAPGTLRPSYRLDVLLHLLPGQDKNLVNRQRVRFHIGTSEVLGRITLLDRDELEPGKETFVQMVMEEPVVAAKGDRFVIRTYSPMHTIGGGEVIDPSPERHKRFIKEVMDSLATKQQGTVDELLLQGLINQQEKLLSLEEAVGQIGIEADEAREALSVLKDQALVHTIEAEGKTYVAASEVYDKWVATVVNSLQEFHRTYPLRFGLTKEELRSRFFKAFSNKLFNTLLQYWSQQGILDVDEQVLAVKGFQPKADAQVEQLINKAMGLYREQPFQPPGWREVVEALKIPPQWQEEIVFYLVNKGDLVKIADDMYFNRTALDEARGRLVAYLKEHKELQLGQARDILQSSRKYILPLLEYFDHQRLTRRVGDKRVLA
ncbi:MAG: selenocysteine-specific translation elongation factor [Clostridia bacterium]|nr:selenocysteine-specific translation elongation factor [Clostridia bacterium]